MKSKGAQQMTAAHQEDGKGLISKENLADFPKFCPSHLNFDMWKERYEMKPPDCA